MYLEVPLFMTQVKPLLVFGGVATENSSFGVLSHCSSTE